jgi:hypothetical protein
MDEERTKSKKGKQKAESGNWKGEIGMAARRRTSPRKGVCPRITDRKEFNAKPPSRQVAKGGMKGERGTFGMIYKSLHCNYSRDVLGKSVV